VLNEAIRRNGKPYPPADLDQLRILPGVPSAVARLREAGFLTIVVTNQPDVARGAQTRGQVEAINGAIRAQVPVDEIRVCYHDDDDQCDCRKPGPALIVEAARQHGVDLTASFMVGDRWRDVEAGVAAGCRTVFIDRGYAERRPHAFDASASSLAEAAPWILNGATR
jgi:D-glycero-D-manno-heptose 1,7-bisphosphate phosphatase